MYSRDKALAILTGLMCGLIFLSATTLGTFYYVSTIGWLGIFAASGLLILDMAIIWASYIDHHEDGTILEYVAWSVKGIGAVYLLFFGGCLIYVLSERGFEAEGLKTRNQATVDYLKQCKESGMSERTCRETGKQQIQAVKREEAPPSFADLYIHHPASKIVGPVLGLICLIALTFAAKWSTRPNAPVQPLQTSSASIRVAPASAPLRLPAGQSGHASLKVPFNGGTFSFRKNGNGYVCWLRIRGGTDKYLAKSPMLGQAEVSILASMNAADVAREVLSGRGWNVIDANVRDMLLRISKNERVP